MRQLSRSVWIIAALLITGAGTSHGAAHPCRRLADGYRQSDARPTSLADLKDAYENRLTFFEKLQKAAPAITEVEAEISGSGTMNRGVYRVRTADGRRMVLKVSLFYEQRFTFAGPKGPERHSADLEGAMVIQHELAKHGLAPDVHGILNRNAVLELLPKLKRFAPYLKEGDFQADRVVGILMDEVDGAWNIRKEPTRVPTYLNDYPASHWQRQLRRLRKALDTLQVQLVDEQFTTTTGGSIEAFDLEYAFFLGRKKVKAEYDPWSMIQTEPLESEYMEAIQGQKND